MEACTRGGAAVACTLPLRAVVQAKPYPGVRSPPLLPALVNLWPSINPPHTVVICIGWFADLRRLRLVKSKT